MTKTTLHTPVLLKSVLEMLNPEKGESYLDLTAGMGGHAREILGISGNYKDSVLVDRDDFAHQNLTDLEAKGCRLIKSDFFSAASKLVDLGSKFDLILIDLGVSSPQLDDASRGFSFQKESVLDMRMDRENPFSAHNVVNEYSTKRLMKLIAKYGEENASRAEKIAREIVQNRPINSTLQLAEVVKKALPGGWQKTHPATKTFQAVRIEVNDELGQIEKTIKLLPDLLNPGGRVAVISFHSLEDRLVKQYFKHEAEKGLISKLVLINKKPILGAVEDVFNPRSRSSKLRGALKK